MPRRSIGSRGFERGCDDYLNRPYAYPELRARIAALLRRRTARRHESRACGSGTLEVDALARQAWIDGVAVPLSSKEFSLLHDARARARARVQARRADGDGVGVERWRPRRAPTRTLDSHASRLRRKLSAHGAGYVVNVWGVGYRLIDVPAASRDDCSSRLTLRAERLGQADPKRPELATCRSPQAPLADAPTSYHRSHRAHRSREPIGD